MTLSLAKKLTWPSECGASLIYDTFTAGENRFLRRFSVDFTHIWRHQCCLAVVAASSHLINVETSKPFNEKVSAHDDCKRHSRDAGVELRPSYIVVDCLIVQIENL
jgi:hypothetical protein